MDVTALLDKARTALLDALPDAWAFYVYGSVARGEAGPGSDIDLVDLREAGDLLRMEVLREGKDFYAADADRLLEWEAQAMSFYFDHRLRIRGVVEDFARTGVGYAP